MRGTIIVIPARYGSSRFAGKPLHPVAGVSMLERVWRIAKTTKSPCRVLIATEDERVIAHAQSFGAEAVLTSPECQNGTERVFEAIRTAKADEDCVINLQGDALLTPPWVLDEMIQELELNRDIEIVTPAVKLDSEALAAFRAHKCDVPASGTTVTFDVRRNALYFSKTIIPFTRAAGFAAIYRHIGLYGYRTTSLAKYISLEPTPLEQTEGLEQLRALENGIPIRVVVVDYRGRTHGSIDAPQDVAVVETIIRREGELVENVG